MPLSHLNGFLRRARTVSIAAASTFLIFSGAAYFDWSRDNTLLRRQAIEVTRSARNASDTIVVLNHWVYGHKGFAKNQNYHLIKALGPTPVQILSAGGDCSDKSRLLSAMLYQLGISSGLVMIYPCASCSPIHTVVEAEYEKGRMVVDPIWNIDYPAGDGRYYGVRDLAGTAMGRERLLRLKAQSGVSAKIAAMPDTEATFDYARGLNWNKNPGMRTGGAILRRMNVEPAFLLRPRVLEDPKLAIWIFLLLAAASLFAVWVAIGMVTAKIAARPSAVMHGAAGGQLGNNVAKLS